MKRNLMFGDLGGSVIKVSDTLHQEYGDYKEVARIGKRSGAITWLVERGLDNPNENLGNQEKFNGTIREVVERFATSQQIKY